MRRLTAVVTAIVALLAACADEGPSSGTVVEHRYDDPDRWMQCMPVGSLGQPGYSSCGIQIWHDDPERFILVIDDGEDSGEVEVSEQLWHTVEDGQFVDTQTGEIR